MNIGGQESMLKEAFSACKKAFVVVAIFSFFVNMLMLTAPLYMLQLFDRVLASRSYDTLIHLTTIAIIALLVLALVDIARSRILVRVSCWLNRRLGPASLEMAPDKILQGDHYGSQSLKDLDTVRNFLGGVGVFALFDAPWVPIFLVIIFLLNPILGGIATAGAVIIFTLALLNELSTRKPLAEANIEAIKTTQHIDSAMRNAEAIQAMGMMPAIVKQWYEDNQGVLTKQMLASDRAATILSLSKFFRFTIQIAMLGTGAFLVVNNEITPGVMIAASILMGRALQPVEQSIGGWKQMIAARQANKRLKLHFQKGSTRISGIQLPKPTGIVEIENTYYMVPGLQKPILNGININISAGEMVAIIGPSGAGKSTIARLIMGTIKANGGSVRLDGASVYDWEREDFGQHVGYLPQDVELFNGSVAHNIARMAEFEDSAVIEAAKMAGVHEMILELPGGYKTPVINGGFGLSGGQRQRIALARALYRCPPLIVLDEPNSNLDNDGEEALLTGLQAAREKKSTIILIAHRPSIVKHVDKVIVINEGRVQLQGPRDEVLGQVLADAKKI